MTALTPLLFAFNHLLAQHSWAARRLAPHQGKRVRVMVPPLALDFQISPEGTAVPWSDGAEPDAVLRISPVSAMAWVSNPDHLAAGVDLAGDVELAGELAQILPHLRWDASDDLAPWLGDALASRLPDLVRQRLGRGRLFWLSLVGNLAEHWTEERPLLVSRLSGAQFGVAVAELRDDVARLEQRLARLDACG